jgi:hypothetical protein
MAKESPKTSGTIRPQNTMMADENTNIGRGKRKVECLYQAINMYIIWKTKPHAKQN